MLSRDGPVHARCRESLALCEQLTSQAVGVLDHYMQRIDDLDRIIQPVAQRTQVRTRCARESAGAIMRALMDACCIRQSCGSIWKVIGPHAYEDEALAVIRALEGL